MSGVGEHLAGNIRPMRERQRSVRSDIVTDVERPWLELLDELGVVGVRDRLLEAGLPVSQAAGLALWLHDQGSQRRHVSPDGARRYRRLLEGLEPPGRSPKLRAIPGYLNLSTRRAA